MRGVGIARLPVHSPLFSLNTLAAHMPNIPLTRLTTAADGFSYERAAITKWFKRSSRSPKTNQPLQHRHLIPNNNLRILIQDQMS